MADTVNYSAIMQFLDEWHIAGGNPRDPQEMLETGISDQSIQIALYCRSIYWDGERYYLRNRELIGPLLGGDISRAKRITSDLLQTMRKNAHEPTHIERTCLVNGIREDAVDEFRQKCMKEFGRLLVELDNWATDRYDRNGVRVGLSLFQFDALDDD